MYLEFGYSGVFDGAGYEINISQTICCSGSLVKFWLVTISICVVCKNGKALI
jgi:hypothetical protein